MHSRTTLLAAALAAFSGAALADAIPYPNPGTENPVVYTFTAASTGDLTAWFYSASGSYNKDIGLLVDGVDTGINGLASGSSTAGQTLDFGNVTAGQVLTFYLAVQSTSEVYYSNPALNADGVNHVYSTSFSGAGTIPAGTYIAFEDEYGTTVNGSDLNYQDEQFVVNNTSTAAVPEPGTLVLMAGGLGMLGLLARRRRG